MSWQLLVFAGLAAIVVGGFAWYERHRPPARLVALVAALAALAVAGRLALAPFPNVVATTDVALLTGYALGGPAGFAVGALAAPISNIWLGQGPWTLWQMGAWGMVGLGGAWLATLSGRRLGRLGLAAACGVAGLAYGALLDFSLMVTYAGEQSLDRYLALSARGVPFNVAHVVGNVAIALAAAPALVRMISRYRTRFEFSWQPVAAASAVLAALALIPAALGGSQPARAQAQTAAQEKGSAAATRAWLAREQNADGGFGASPEFPSSPSMTGWVMLALESSGTNPLDLRRGGETPVSYLRERLDRLRSVNDLERTILALDGAGIDPRRFGGVDLVAQLRERRDGDGSIDGEVNLTAFYVLAMRAGGADAGDLGRSAEWLRKAQNRDGGWGFRPDAPSDPDTTGAALQAIAAAGSGGKTSEAAVRWLARVQRGGGFGLATTGAVNSQSTAWAAQGLVAAGATGEPLDDALAYIERLRASDGHYRYSAASDQTPVWVTAQALLALEREPLPLPATPRAPAPARAGDDGGEGSGGGGGGAATTGPAGPGPGPSVRSGGGKGNDAGGRSGGTAGTRERGGAGGDGHAASAEGAAADRPDNWTPYAPLAAEDVPAAGSADAGSGDDADGSAAAYVAGGAALVAALAGVWLWRRRRA